MIPVCRDEISTRPAGTDFTLRLHVEIKFRPGKAGHFSTWHLQGGDYMIPVGRDEILSRFAGIPVVL